MAAKTLDGIQILRGIAALAVVLLHMSQMVHAGNLSDADSVPVLTGGGLGVDIFFMVSGFIMLYTSKPEFGAPHSGRKFLVRRLIRVVPLYWLCTLLLVGLRVAHPVEDYLTWTRLGSSLFFISLGWPLLELGWTLNYEMYFYLIFAAWLAVGTPKTGPYLIGLTIIIVLLAGRLLVREPPSPDDAVGFFGRQFFANTIVIEFCFGMSIAQFATIGHSTRKLTIGLISASAFLFTLILLNRYTAEGIDPRLITFRFLIAGVAAPLVYAATAVEKIKARIAMPLLLLGNASYSIYLTHVSVMMAFAWPASRRGMSSWLSAPVWLLVLVAAAMLVGILTFFLIERPMTRYLQSKLSPERAVSVAAVSGPTCLVVGSETPFMIAILR